MSRHDETIGRMPNPSQYFLEWNAEQKTFCYYSKDDSSSKPFDLPFRFLALKFMNSITGYDDILKTGIYSNEVTDTRKEHFRVNRRDGSVLASGMYSDIKDDLSKSGGKFTRSIYALTTKGAIVNIQLRGSQIFSFGVIEKFGNRWRDEWIQVTSYETKTFKQNDKDIEYTTPVFSFGGSLTNDDISRADKAYVLVIDYFKSKSVTSGSSVPARPAQQPTAVMPVTNSIPANFTAIEGDDLPF